MTRLEPVNCPISGETGARRVFSYDAAPSGEIGFRRVAGEPYHREVWQFPHSRHYVSRHAMTVATDYHGDYVDATYGDAAGVARTFERIIALPPERSDNAGRMRRVSEFAQAYMPGIARPRLLDIGSGLGVFPHAVKSAGWDCIALDPDARAVQHIRDRVGVEAVCGDFMEVGGLGQFDVVTLNKVLEHVTDPVAMLARTREFVSGPGFAYVEVPDGEMAARAGFQREEFFIEHLHVFSLASLAIMADRAGFTPIAIERLQEPSTKYTLRAFLAATHAGGSAAHG